MVPLTDSETKLFQIIIAFFPSLFLSLSLALFIFIYIYK